MSGSELAGVSVSLPAADGPVAWREGNAQQLKRTFQEFETTLMSAMLEQSLPKGTNVFGAGVAGGFARTQLAQQLAGAVAARGTLGIADRVGAVSMTGVLPEAPPGQPARKP